jgi:hypothetical protein
LSSDGILTGNAFISRPISINVSVGVCLNVKKERIALKRSHENLKSKTLIDIIVVG